MTGVMERTPDHPLPSGVTETTLYKGELGCVGARAGG